MIKPKSVIQSKDFKPYDGKNFKTPSNFYDCDADTVLQMIKPFEVDGKKFIVVDTETHPTDLASTDLPFNVVRRWIGSGKTAKPQDFPFCISICDGTNCFTVFDDYENNFNELAKLQPLLEDTSIGKICHNWKYDAHMLQNSQLFLGGEQHDTVILAKLVDENRKSYQLVDLARGCGGITEYEDMVDYYKKANKITDYRQIPRNLLAAYANADVWNCFKVFTNEYGLLGDCKELYYIELKLMQALYDMERVGMRVDVNYKPIVEKELQDRADAAERKVYELAGGMFNMNSTKQLVDALIKVGVDPYTLPKTGKGNVSVDKGVMAELEKQGVEIVKYILEYRKCTKLLNTYVVGIYGQRDSVNRVHGNINQVEATTGRMSITKPALQTLHKKDTTIRKAFIPEDGYKLVFIDMDQVEYRIFAHYARAEELIDMIKNGHDVHGATAGILYKLPIEDVTPEQRSIAKTLNFSLLYGSGTAALADSLGVSQSEAYEFKRRYFAQLPTAEPFIYEVHNVNKSRGFIKTFYGRKRRLKYDESYKAPNALIQGTAADVLKVAIIKVHEFLQDKKSRVLLPVHDELVFEVHESELDIIPMLKELMEDKTNFRVPLTVGIDLGNKSWGEKISYEKV